MIRPKGGDTVDEKITDPAERAKAEKAMMLPDSCFVCGGNPDECDCAGEGADEHLWLDALWLWACSNPGFPTAQELAFEMFDEWDDPVSPRQAQEWLDANFPKGFNPEVQSGEPKPGFAITGFELQDTTVPGTDSKMVLWRLYDREQHRIVAASYSYEELADRVR